MKKIILLLIVLVVVAAGALAFWFYRGEAFRIVITQEQLQEQMNQHFPFSETYLALFEIKYENPVVKIDAEKDRVAVGLDAVTAFKLAGGSYKGTALVSGGLKYVPDSASFFLTDAKIETLEITDVPEKYSEQVTKYGSEILAAYLTKKPVYTITDENVQMTAAKMLLKDVRAETGALVVELGLPGGGQVTSE